MLTPLQIYRENPYKTFGFEGMSQSTNDYLGKAILHLNLPSYSHDISMALQANVLDAQGLVLQQFRDEIRKVEQWAYAKWAKGKSLC